MREMCLENRQIICEIELIPFPLLLHTLCSTDDTRGARLHEYVCAGTYIYI